MSDLADADATLVVIVPHERCRTRWWSEKLGGKVVFLADPGFWVSSMYGVAFQMRIHTDTSNTPGTFVVDQQGALRWSHVGQGKSNWRDRPTAKETLAKVKEFAPPPQDRSNWMLAKYCLGDMLGAVLIFCVAGCSTSTTPTAEPSSAVTAPEPSPSVAPGTTLAESDFQATLRATGAKYLVLQVFAEACGPCMTEALRLSGRREAWEAEGVAILGLGMDETAEATRKFDQDLGGRIAYPLYHAPWFAKRYDVEATPTLFLYSANGVPLLRADPESADPDAFTVIEAELQRRLGD